MRCTPLDITAHSSRAAYGWLVIVDDDIQKPCVAKWRDEVYVGTYGDLGLCKLEGGQLISFKPKVQAMSFDVRENLVALMSSAIVGTYDGNDYQATFVQSFENVANRYPPQW